MLCVRSVVLRRPAPIQLENIASEQKLVPLLLDLHGKTTLKRFSIRPDKFQYRIAFAVFFDTFISPI